MNSPGARGTARPDRLWTPPFAGVMVLNGVTMLNFLFLMSSMTGYAVSAFGAGETQAGLAAGTFVLGALLARVFVGKFTDLVGRRQMLVIAAAIMLLGSFGYFLASAFPLLVLVRAVQGAAFGAVSNVASTVSMSMIPVSRRGEGVGWFTLSVTISQAIGPALGLWLMSYGDYRILFGVGAGLCCVAAVLALLLPIEEIALSAGDRAALRSWRLDRILEPRALAMGCLALLVVLPWSGILTFMNGYAEEAGLLPFASAFFLVYAAGLAVARPIAGRLLDRLSDNAVILPALLAHVLALVLFALELGPAGFFASAVLLAFGYGSLVPLWQAIAVRRTPAARTSMAISTFYIGLDLGTGAGPVVLGAVIGLGLAYRDLFWLLAAWSALVAAVYLLLHGRTAAARARRR